jgi:hypothetical protein
LFWVSFGAWRISNGCRHAHSPLLVVPHHHQITRSSHSINAIGPAPPGILVVPVCRAWPNWHTINACSLSTVLWQQGIWQCPVATGYLAMPCGMPDSPHIYASQCSVDYHCRLEDCSWCEITLPLCV